MKFRFSFIDDIIEISDEYVRSLEVENNNYFIRMVTCLNNYCIQTGDYEELIIDDANMDIIIDYFNISSKLKKDNLNLLKYIENKIDDLNYDKIRKNYNKIYDIFTSLVYDLDLPVELNKDYNVNKIIKTLNISFKTNNNLLQNIYNYLDINILFNKSIIIFVNLKSYLSKNELIELYKYCVYNKIKILLLDNKSYGTTLKCEKKIIIDCNLNEYVL